MQRTSVLQPCSSNIHIRTSPSFLPCCYGTGCDSTRLSQIVPDCIIGVGGLPHITVYCCTLLYIVVHCHTLPYIAVYCHTIPVVCSIYALLFPSLPYPMPCVVVSSCTPVLSLWNAKDWLYPAIDYLNALILIITPINFVEV